ncbi:MAG TPA: hypothetical protein VMS08_03890 [Candidatus Saccharimonadia bacterium]|nr:hypothetical protein [Candidatus Saccharimonadia bacterium]
MDTKRVKVTSIKPSTVAMFEGMFGLLAGIVIAFVYSIRVTIGFTSATNSLLQGLMLGLGAGFFALIALAIIYFAIGWVAGYVQALIFNVVASSMGGIEVATRTPASETPREATYSPQSSRRAEPTFGETIDHRRR